MRFRIALNNDLADPPDQHWQRKLEAAQNVLFCKELFSQLAKEAISLQARFQFAQVLLR